MSHTLCWALGIQREKALFLTGNLAFDFNLFVKLP